MIISRTNLALAVVVLLVFLAAGTVDVDHSRPNYEFLPEMKYSPAYGAFEANPSFANGRTLQAPVAGTIARGEMPLHYAATKEDALRAGEELNNPYDSGSGDEQVRQSAAASVQRGSELFRIYCACCHGLSGMGDGPVAQGKFAPIRDLLGEQSRQMPDGQMFHVLTYGQGEVAPGQGGMASFAAQLTPDQRWDVINYVRSMQQRAAATASAPEPVPESPSP